MTDHDEDPGWSPEDDNIEKQYLKRAMKMMDQIEATNKSQAHRPTSVAFVGIASQPEVSIRAIENGFILRYIEVTERPALPPPGQVSGLVAGLTAPHHRVVEMFVVDSYGFGDHLMKAMESLRKLSDKEPSKGA